MRPSPASFELRSWDGGISSSTPRARRSANSAVSARSLQKKSERSPPTPSSARKASICSASKKRARRYGRPCDGSAIWFAVPRLPHRKGDDVRTKLPRMSAFVDRHGVKIYYEIYGDGPETMLFLPPWPIVHSRIYKAQLPYFSERFRCIAYDGRGNGKSDRPTDVAAYSLDHYVAD